MAKSKPRLRQTAPEINPIIPAPARVPYPDPLPFDLRPYQQVCFGDLLRWVDADENQDAAGLGRLYEGPCGSGKSVIELAAMATLGGKAILTTPRLEIVAGMMQKLGYKTNHWSDAVLAMEAAQYGIWTPIRLRNALAKGRLEVRPRYWLVDECFPAGTLVDGQPIEDYLPGDRVRAFDPTTGLTRLREVTRVFVKPAPARMVRLQIASRCLVVTPNHPIYTDGGWVNAEEVTPGTRVLLDLCADFRRLPVSEVPVEASYDELLFPGVHDRRDPGRPVGPDVPDQRQACVRPDEGEQPDEAGRRPGEGQPDAQADRAPAPGTRGQRDGANGSRTTPVRSDRVTTLHVDNQGPAGVRVSHELQARPGLSRNETGGGDRRVRASGNRATEAGPEEGTILVWARVDGVEVLQRGRVGEPDEVCPDGHVYNLEVEGEHTYFAEGVGVHNCHHELAESYQQIARYLGPYVVRIGFTATAFRGTPKATREFLKGWGDEVVQFLDVRKAAELKVIQVPGCDVWPLVNDDMIAVRGGEFVVEDVEGATEDVVDALVARVVESEWVRYDRPFPESRDEFRMWDKATVFAVATTALANQLADRLNEHGCRAEVILQDTPRQVRVARFSLCEAREIAIVQIDVVSEGNDLKLRRLVDLKPTLSPVRWMQQVGRVMRPTEEVVEYVCCNRNLERFCYLFDGMLPPRAAGMTAEVFEDDEPASDEFRGASPNRPAMRAVGLSDIGRFRPGRVHWADGTIGFIYSLVHVEVADEAGGGARRTEHAILGHPLYAELLYAYRQSVRDPLTQTMKWSRWERRSTESIPADFRGYSSAAARTLSPKQLVWWKRPGTVRLGLDNTVTPTTREFQALPVLTDVRGVPESWTRR